MSLVTLPPNQSKALTEAKRTVLLTGCLCFFLESKIFTTDIEKTWYILIKIPSIHIKFKSVNIDNLINRLNKKVNVPKILKDEWDDKTFIKIYLYDPE